MTQTRDEDIVRCGERDQYYKTSLVPTKALSARGAWGGCERDRENTITHTLTTRL